MDERDDPTLLRRFADHRDELAFRALVERHLPLVRASAMRQLDSDPHRADDVAQTVFTLLAARAAALVRHPTLAGWLFTTARRCAQRLRRTQTRRMIREREAVLLDDLTGVSGIEAAWLQVRPVLDSALAGLNERDRDGVLLRYFENRSYAEIAARIGTSENAARMRVERALEKLRDVLHRRGVTSTAATLATVLGSQAAPAVSEALVMQITLQATTGVATAGAVRRGGASFFMNTAKIGLTAAALALAVVVYELHALRGLRLETAAAGRRAAELQRELEVTRQALAEAKRRADAADEDNAHLLGAIEETKRQGGGLAAPKAGAAPLTRAQVLQRYEKAKSLVKSGQYAEALAEYLWCYDAGMTGLNFVGLRTESLPRELAELGRSYPPALRALRERRDRAAAALKEDWSDQEALYAFLGTAQAVAEPAAWLELLQQAPAGSRARDRILRGGAYEVLVAGGRYADAVAAKPFAEMAKDFDSGLAFVNTEYTAPENAVRRAEELKRIMGESAANFEVLLGAGDVKHANELAAKALAFDDSPSMRAMLREHAARAGHPEWKPR